MKNCGSCKKWKCRCADCCALDPGDWYCDEYEDYCENITDCSLKDEQYDILDERS